MKILFIGDIVGKAAREKVKNSISQIKNKYKPDIIIANAENATGGHGLSKKDAQVSEIKSDETEASQKET